MAYRVELARAAEAELEELHLWVTTARGLRVRRGSTVWSEPRSRSTSTPSGARWRRKGLTPTDLFAS